MIHEDDPIINLTARFGPILKAAFPNEHSITRMGVATALAEIVILTTPTRIEAEQPQEAVEEAPLEMKVRLLTKFGGTNEHTKGWNTAVEAACEIIRAIQAAESGLLDEALEACRKVVSALHGRIHSRDALAAVATCEEVLAKAGKPGEAGNGEA